MNKPQLSRTRIALALAIAVVADLLQYPITAVEATGVLAMPGEFVDFMVDCVVMGATTLLLGFHWMLLPSFVLELLPGLDLLPSWTACVGYVIWQRKREQARAPPPVIEVQAVQVMPEPPPLIAARSSPPALSPGLDAAKRSVEERLRALDDLLGKKIISQAEYEARRQQVLADI